jgi:SAM-dependent methyltransferase
MIPDPEKIRLWQARAPAYDRLCRRWEIFALLSHRLIDALPADLHGTVLDIGAGSGLTSEVLLARHPRCRTILIEPSGAMLDIARKRLAGRTADFLPMGLDRVPVRDLRAVAAIASASMQFLDLDPALATLADVIEPEGHVAFNLWWHHWQETAASDCAARSEAIASAACNEAGIAPPPPPPVPQKVKTRAELTDASRKHGFTLVLEQRDEYPTPAGFTIDFEAMNVDWPVKGLAQDAREAVLARMHELARGEIETLVSTRFVLRRQR